MRKFRSIFACFRGQSVVQSVRQPSPVESTVTVRVGLRRGRHFSGVAISGQFFFLSFFCCCAAEGFFFLRDGTRRSGRSERVCVCVVTARVRVPVCAALLLAGLRGLRNLGSGRNCVRKGDFFFCAGNQFRLGGGKGRFQSAEEGGRRAKKNCEFRSSSERVRRKSGNLCGKKRGHGLKSIRWWSVSSEKTKKKIEKRFQGKSGATAAGREIFPFKGACRADTPICTRTPPFREGGELRGRKRNPVAPKKSEGKLGWNIYESWSWDPILQ